MTGMPADHRDARNTALSALLQQMAQADVRQDIWLLGLVELQELHALLRGAAVVLQPSLFEGWSTTVQDARALGRPVICSNLAVHREQAPDAFGFIDPNNAETLAALLASFSDFPPGPDHAKETVALEQERAFGANHGLRLWSELERITARG